MYVVFVFIIIIIIITLLFFAGFFVVATHRRPALHALHAPHASHAPRAPVVHREPSPPVARGALCTDGGGRGVRSVSTAEPRAHQRVL